MTRLLSTIVIVFFGLTNLSAQSNAYNQVYASPLTLNPAMAGIMPEQGPRLAFNFMAQREVHGIGINPTSPSSVINSIQIDRTNMSSSFDMSIPYGTIGKDYVGVGCLLEARQLELGGGFDGFVNYLSASISLATHKALDPDRRYVISLGGQATAYSQSHRDQKKFDASAGAVFTARPKNNVSLFGGMAVFNIAEPQLQMVTGTGSFVDMVSIFQRFVYHGGATFKAAEKFVFSPSFVYSTQSGANDMLLGANLGFNKTLPSEQTLGVFAGLSVRVHRAIIPMVGLDYNERVKIGVSYSIDSRDLSEASINITNYPELSLVCMGKNRSGTKKHSSYPRF